MPKVSSDDGIDWNANYTNNFSPTYGIEAGNGVLQTGLSGQRWYSEDGGLNWALTTLLLVATGNRMPTAHPVAPDAGSSSINLP